jgi:hypothetical protein
LGAKKIKKGFGDRGALGILAASETLKTREEFWLMLSTSACSTMMFAGAASTSVVTISA